MALQDRCLTWLKDNVESRVKEQLNHLTSYGTRVRELKTAIDELKAALDRVERKFDEQKSRYLRRNDEVEKWKKNVNDLISQYQKFDLDKRHDYAKFDLFTTGYLPKPGIRYRLSRKANEIAKNVDDALQQMNTLDEFSYWRGPPSMADFFADTGYESLPSRDETVKKIMVALKDPGVRMIGVHGLSGVGKTTLAKKVAKRALDDKVFDVLIMTSVTKSAGIRGIQGQIAEMLGMTLEEESETGRAARIRDRILGNEKEKTLIILDDLWEKLDFSMLGFPSMNVDGNLMNNLKDEKSGNVPGTSTMVEGKDLFGASKSNTVQTQEPIGHRHKGCKIIMISETEQVLSSQMEGKAGNSVFYVEPLKEQEAETLFKKMAGIGDKKNFEFEKLAAQIASECSGLPMSIVPTAKALKGKSRPVWEDTLRKLERENISGVPEFSIRLSYDLLGNEELKYTFLLCARVGRDILIMDFVRYCIGLGFLQGIYTVAEARDRVSSLLLELKESGLLSDSYSSNRFTMQNIVQGAALSIASKEKQVFMMTKGRLDEWPDEDELERYTAISLRHCDIIEFPQSLRCSRLKVLHVDGLAPHLKIPDNFFEGMMELRVLILIGIHLSPIPPSLRYLTKLRMLCLERCMLDVPLSIIGELKNLRILSLAGSDFKKLPDELKQLAKLQILDISDCSKLVIPPDVISSLTSLEDLYMRNTSIQWKVEGQENKSDNASLSELSDLNQLRTLDIQIPSVAYLPEDLFFDKLDNYKIVIGDLNTYSERDFKMPGKYEASRFLALQIKDDFDIHTQKGVKMLFESVENLLLGELHGVTHVFHELNLKGFPYLKFLSIVSNSDIQYIIKSQKHPEKAFTKLESMCLYKLINMEHICHGEFKDASFGKLKIIKISICDKLKNVFLSSMVGFLSALETIEVSECNSLKEIVTVRNGTNKMEFPKLRILKLQSLSEFVGFYTTTKELFDEKVVVSELERVELSSLNKIEKIWSDEPLSSFGKLTHLDVSDCGSLPYLLSFSMAEKLVNLQSLVVSKCGMMENVFNPEKVGKGSIFPKLKNIKLSCLKRLRNIWQSKGPSNSYDKLESLIIEDCDKLDHVFATDMVGRFQSLCNLSVTSCNSMRVIFDLKDDRKRDAGPRDATKLQNVHLEALPKLEHIWKEKPEVILNFQSLQKIWVSRCPSLENIFPVSVAKGLKELEYLVVLDCGWLEHIVAKGNIQFELPKLATIHFSGLPKLQSFYPGAKLNFPALNELSVELCDQLEPFKTETEGQPQPIETGFFPAEMIYNLKSMLVEQRDAKWLKDYIGDYRMYNLEELRFSTLLDYEILYFFLHRSPNLKSLWLNNCFFEELVPRARLPENEKLGVVPKLKMLKLIDLPSLQDIGFERDKILQRIESLILKKCPRLITILPPSVSFTDLTYLEVVNCDDLTDLMAPSTARSLVQLTTMKVIQCRQMKEIVSQKGDESKVTIVFRKLKALELVSLLGLICFCSSESCTFSFPSLEKLVVSLCPAIISFTSDKNKPPNLRQIYIAHRKVGPRYCLWEGDINATIKKIYEDKLYLLGADKAEVRSHLTLRAWDIGDKWQGFSFDSLKTLKLKDCNFGSHAITATVLPNLKNLTNLHVQNCSRYKLIFDTKYIKGATFLLKKLTLDGLPNLANVWDKNSTEGLVSFQNLEKVVVANCTSLKTVFPAALAKNLKKLEELDIWDCKELREIVETEGSQELLFPSLSSLNLYKLPQLTYFHPEILIREEFNRLDVLSCGKLELFQWEQEALPEGQEGTSANSEPVSLDQKVIPENLEALTLNWKDTEMLCRRRAPVELDKLNQLKLCFDDASDVPSLPFELFVKGVKAPNLKLLQVSRCSSGCGLKEIFPSQNDKEIGKDGILEHLNEICLLELSELKSIGLEHSWVSRLCEKLQTLTVTSCPCLTTLIVQEQPAVSFSHLKQLTVQDCRGLKNLFTSSMAKKLESLQEMHIQQCESMEEVVVAEEVDGTNAQETRFEKLKTIVLDSLTSLQSFYSGDDTLQLPSLIKVVIRQCPKMGLFSQTFKLPESSSRILFSLDSDHALVLHNDLNAKVERMFLRQENLSLGDYPLLQKIWLGEVPVPDRCFSNLKSLVVEGCDFLSNAILPSHILSSLSNLEELQVRKCNSVEAIFDHKGPPTSDPLNICFKKLILEKLPNLKRVWNDDPQGSLHISCLGKVSVNGCKSIMSLSVDKRLKKLNVKNCQGLVEIVAKDEEATKGAAKLLIPLPRLSLTSLRLRNLPNLKRIYPGMLFQGRLKLKALDVSLCQMRTILETEFQNAPDSHPKGQDRSPTDLPAFCSLEKVTQHLEQLSLNKEDTMMIIQGKLCVDLQNLKFLKFQFFDLELDVFPYWFFSKVSPRNIEKLGVVDSAFKEIFPSQKPNIDITKILSQLKDMELDRLSELESIGFEHSWIKRFPENLQTLIVLACNSLKNLAPSTVSFSDLTELIVENCEGLDYLFTSSTAKSLGKLKKMSITNCISIKTIVAKEGHEPDGDKMEFGKLKILSLSKLPILGSFYMGTSTLNFPSLEEVSFTRCHNMKIFCNGDVILKNLEAKIDGMCWHGDLNTVIKRQSQEGSSQN